MAGVIQFFVCLLFIQRGLGRSELMSDFSMRSGCFPGRTDFQNFFLKGDSQILHAPYPYARSNVAILGRSGQSGSLCRIVAYPDGS